jgi:hypothetical protein
MRRITAYLILFCCLLLGAGLPCHAQYLRPKKTTAGPISSTVETGLAKMPTEKELIKMMMKVLKADEHKDFLKQIQENQPSRPKGVAFEQAFRWDLVRTRGWTTKLPYIRAYCMLGNIMSAVVAIPVKVEAKKLVIDNDRQIHGCIPIDCPVCILQFNTDSLLLGCSTYGVDEAYYKAHPTAQCQHYLRKPFGERISKELDPALMDPKKYNQADKSHNKAKPKKSRK